ncbi:MAG: hypothetical protein V1672_03585 [Candidatus Diapherotrites archaeon]
MAGKNTADLVDQLFSTDYKLSEDALKSLCGHAKIAPAIAKIIAETVFVEANSRLLKETDNKIRAHIEARCKAILKDEKIQQEATNVCLAKLCKKDMHDFAISLLREPELRKYVNTFISVYVNSKPHRRAIRKFAKENNIKIPNSRNDKRGNKNRKPRPI